MHVCVCVACVFICVCMSALRLLITNGVMLCDIDPI